MEKKKIIGSNIKRHRQFKGWTQKVLADKVGLEEETISRIESGKENFGIDNLMKIIDVLNLGMEEICLEEGKLVSLRFILSENNANTLIALLHMVKEILEKKNKTI